MESLNFAALDPYAGVRSGEVFLSTEEEALIVQYLDRLADDLANDPDRFSDPVLRDAAMLLSAFQYAMRPLQIAMVRLRDVRVWNDDEASPAVHVTFLMVKQRTSRKSIPLTRKVKHEWSIVIRELHRRHSRQGANGGEPFFCEFGQKPGPRISALLKQILAPDGATPTDLRHTAAQRLVDAGASHEELAAFLGHARTSTGLVYFQTSASQAELVNKALGISDIYSRVARIAHDRFISLGELEKLKGEQQIAGVPHGIPIAGIGACTSGQPACPFNPVLSCYGCHKFMPIHEVAVHKQVLTDFRSVVTFFYDVSRGDRDSPAYLQLQRTIYSVEAIIEELTGMGVSDE